MPMWKVTFCTVPEMHCTIIFNTVWSPYKQYVIEKVEKVQKRATKLVHKCKHLPYADRLK